MKKQLTQKLTLNKQTLRNLSERDLKTAVGGVTVLCTRRCASTETCTDSCGTCDTSLASACC
ncbi:MAG: class I lanthipeptide [Thermoanaerobaculia bacterium]